MLDTIYVIHHSHTDIGFTHDQPIFWELQARFIDEALYRIEEYAVKHPPESAFRWTIETTCGLAAWLKHAKASDVDRLVWAEKSGYLEVTAMFANITPLLDIPQLIESLRPVERLRAEYGFDIRHAMNCDVNGQNWTLADVLLDAGIEGFSMAINHHFGGPPDPRPSVFLWQAPSGRTLPAHNGWQYSKAADFGLGDETDERFAEWLPRIEAYLNEIHYPLPFIILEGFHPFGDNGRAWNAYAEFARRWNESGHAPRIVTATPRMFWERVKIYGAELNTLLGDWTTRFAVPLAVAASGGVVDAGVLATVGAVVSGGLFGDHCSPVSDTTCLSSFGAASDHMDHVTTQLPYALGAGLLSTALFAIVGWLTA